jgi:hypothetical protein
MASLTDSDRTRRAILWHGQRWVPSEDDATLYVAFEHLDLCVPQKIWDAYRAARDSAA